MPGLRRGVQNKMQSMNKILGEAKELRRRKTLVGIEEISGRLGVRPKTIYAWIHMRQIPHVKVGRLVKFDMEDVDRWIEARKVLVFK